MDRDEAVSALLQAMGDLTRRRSLRPVNRTMQGETLALHCLCAHPEGLTPGELGKALSVTAPRVAAILDSLETKGLITRSPAPGDRRKYRILPTDAGLNQEEKHKQFVFQHTKNLVACLEDGEIETLITVLHKLKNVQCKEETQC